MKRHKWAAMLLEQAFVIARLDECELTISLLPHMPGCLKLRLWPAVISGRSAWPEKGENTGKNGGNTVVGEGGNREIWL